MSIKQPLLLLAFFCPMAVMAHDGMVKSMVTYPTDNYWAEPVISLGANNGIIVEFDQLGNDRSYLRYELEHCDSQWNPSGLVDSEFLDGFNEGTIDDYYYSQATVWPYVHYTLAIPNAQMRPTISGNYKVRIFDEQDRDNTLAETRFSISEETMLIDAEASPVTDIGAGNGFQQLSMVVDMQQTPVRDPFSDLKMVITQNNQPWNLKVISHPSRVQGTKAIFDHQRDLIFPAGNEYRRFEATSTITPGMHVEHIDFEEPYYYVQLETDAPRRGKMYLYDQTQGGKFLPRSTDPSDADYMKVLFTLEMPYMPGCEVFIDGDLTGRKLSPESRMWYDHNSGAYRGELMLKQGYYEYRYIAIPGDSNLIEGDFSETCNHYDIRVYHRLVGSRYDRLCGYATLSCDR